MCADTLTEFHITEDLKAFQKEPERLMEQWNSVSFFDNRNKILQSINMLECCDPETEPDTVNRLCEHLNAMFRPYHIKCSGILSSDEYRNFLEHIHIPTQQDWSRKVVHAIYQLFLHYRSPKAYMKRLVCSLADRRFQDREPVRVIILRQMIEYTDYLRGSTLYSPELADLVREQYGSKPEKIGDEIFKTYMKARHYVPANLEAALILERFGPDLYPAGAKDPELTALMQEFDCEYPCDCDALQVLQDIHENCRKDHFTIKEHSADLMQRIDDLLKRRLLAYRKHWEMRTPKTHQDQADRLNDMAQRFAEQLKPMFGKQTEIDKICRCCASLSPADPAPETLDEAFSRMQHLSGKELLKSGAAEQDIGHLYNLVFPKFRQLRMKRFKSVYQQFQKELDNSRRTLNSGICDFLQMCDDLASGVFRSHALEKQRLFYFAIAFGMKYNCKDYPVEDEMRDMEKQLFENYYFNNAVRRLEQSFNKSGDFPEPVGTGINLKNYAELVYLYCLNRDSIPTDQKISTAERIIQTVAREYDKNYEKIYGLKPLKNQNGKKAAQARSIVDKPQALSISVHGNISEDSDVFSLEENDFISYLLHARDVDRSMIYKGEACFDAMFPQNSAAAQYRAMKQELMDLRRSWKQEACLSSSELADWDQLQPGLGVDLSDLKREFSHNQKEMHFFFLIDRLDTQINEVISPILEALNELDDPDHVRPVKWKNGKKEQEYRKQKSPYQKIPDSEKRREAFLSAHPTPITRSTVMEFKYWLLLLGFLKSGEEARPVDYLSFLKMYEKTFQTLLKESIFTPLSPKNPEDVFLCYFGYMARYHRNLDLQNYDLVLNREKLNPFFPEKN